MHLDVKVKQEVIGSIWSMDLEKDVKSQIKRQKCGET